MRDKGRYFATAKDVQRSLGKALGKTLGNYIFAEGTTRKAIGTAKPGSNRKVEGLECVIDTAARLNSRRHSTWNAYLIVHDELAEAQVAYAVQILKNILPIGVEYQHLPQMASISDRPQVVVRIPLGALYLLTKNG